MCVDAQEIFLLLLLRSLSSEERKTEKPELSLVFLMPILRARLCVIKGVSGGHTHTPSLPHLSISSASRSASASCIGLSTTKFVARAINCDKLLFVYMPTSSEPL